MGKGGGGSQQAAPQYVQSPPSTTTTTQNTTPWAGQQPYLTKTFEEAERLYKTPLEFYAGNVPGVPTGQTYTSLSPETQLSMIMAKDQALGGDKVTPAAQQFNADMLSGDYLAADNPYFKNMVSNVWGTVAPQVESQFEKVGRYGSGSMDKALASAMTDTAGNLAYQNYSNVLGEMGKMTALAPQTAALGYLPSQAMSGIGAQVEDQQQQAINQEMAKWQFEQMEPQQRLGLLSGEIGGNYGGSSTSTGTGTAGQWYQPTASSSNAFGNALGGLSSLGSLGLLAYSAFGGSDKRLKDNIKPLPNTAIHLIGQITPVTFDYKPEYGEPNQIGFVADDVEDIIPNMVRKDSDGMRMLSTVPLIPILVKAIQEQQDQINMLRGAVQNLYTSIVGNQYERAA